MTEPESLSYVLMANRERRQLERRFAARQPMLHLGDFYYPGATPQAEGVRIVKALQSNCVIFRAKGA